MDATVVTVLPLKIPTNSDDSHSINEQQSELKRKEVSGCCAVLRSIVPAGGFIAGAFTLASGTVGGGIMGIPSAFQQSGIIVSTIYLIIITMITVYSIYLLAAAAKRTGLSGYEPIARALLGRGGDYLAVFMVFLLSFGAKVSYVIGVGNLWSAVMKNADVPDFWQDRSRGIRVLQVLTWLCFMLPLGLRKRINALRHFNVVSIILMVYFIIVVIVESARDGMSHLGNDTNLVTHGNSAIMGLSVFIFSCLCHPNVFEVWSEMTVQTPLELARQTSLSMSIAGFLYWFTGFFGYAQFGSGIEGNIVLMYNPLSSAFIGISYIGFAIKLFVSFGQGIYPLRDSLYHMLGWKLLDVSTPMNILCCSIIGTVALIGGLFIPNINTVFGLCGSISGGFLGFIYPSLFIMYCGNWSLKEVGLWHWLATYLLLLAGVVACVFGTGATIYETVN